MSDADSQVMREFWTPWVRDSLIDFYWVARGRDDVRVRGGTMAWAPDTRNVTGGSGGPDGGPVDYAWQAGRAGRGPYAGRGVVSGGMGEGAPGVGLVGGLAAWLAGVGGRTVRGGWEFISRHG
ncbi:hypothetical protein [Burkholderia pseudomallei]|uniref:hypothetical protein n=1 Tax=Burkholderia pseudomallei TaxID=28450 RepID=UPI0021F76A42|nr:hypothetical protein [Burkholderia pseudomallei]MCV9986353.1 hypothetical protein [Burkholderia pseudomallei]